MLLCSAKFVIFYRLLQSNLCEEMIRPSHRDKPHPAAGSHLDTESLGYDPALDVPDLSDLEGDNYSHVAAPYLSLNQSQSQEDRVNQWREDTQLRSRY